MLPFVLNRGCHLGRIRISPHLSSTSSESRVVVGGPSRGRGTRRARRPPTPPWILSPPVRALRSGAESRTKYQAEPTTPPSHTIRNVKRSGRTRSIASSTSARMPPAYRRISGGAAIAVEIHSTNGISSRAMTRNPRRHFHRIPPITSLSVVLWPKPQIHLDVPQSSEVRPVEEVDGRILHADEVLVEQGPDEPCTDVVHGHSPAQFVEGRNHDRLPREFRVAFVLPEERHAHPAGNDLPGPQGVAKRGRRMVVSHDEDGSLHDFLVRPGVSVAEPDVLAAEAVRGLEAHAARHDVLQHAVMVALGDVHLAERGRQVAEEHVDIAPLPGGHLRHEVLHVAQDDESRRASAVGQLDQLSAHHLRTAGDADPFLAQLFLY